MGTRKKNPRLVMTTSSIPSQKLEKPQSDGLLVISPTWEILHINQVAYHLLQKVPPNPSSLGDRTVITIELMELAQIMRESLLIERMAGLHDSIQITKTIRTHNKNISVKAFGFPNRQDHDRYRIVFSLSS